MATSSWGEVTTMMPSTGMDWNTVKGTSPRPRRRIDKQEIDVLPDNIGPKLFDHTGNQRTCLKQPDLSCDPGQIDGHDVNTCSCFDWIQAEFRTCGLCSNAKGLGIDGPVTSASEWLRGSPCLAWSQPALTLAKTCPPPFATDNADHLTYTAQRMRFSRKSVFRSCVSAIGHLLHVFILI